MTKSTAHMKVQIWYFFLKKIVTLSVSLDSDRGAFLAFAFLAKSHGIVHDPAKNTKTRIPMYFWVSWHYLYI